MGQVIRPAGKLSGKPWIHRLKDRLIRLKAGWPAGETVISEVINGWGLVTAW